MSVRYADAGCNTRLSQIGKRAYKYFKEHGIKSPFFRSWFGDWRANDRDNKVSIATIPHYVDTPEARLSYSGTFENADTSWQIKAAGHGIRNTNAHAGGGYLSLQGVSGINELIEKAIWLDTETHGHHTNNKKDDRIAFDRKLYALGVSDAGGVALYKLTIEEYYQDHKHPEEKRFHNLRYVQKIADNISDLTHSQSRGADFAKDASAIDVSVADLHALVKQYDENFKPKSVNPVLLNEDGTPKVFYHGTSSVFTAFKSSEINAREGSFFFAENREV